MGTAVRNRNRHQTRSCPFFAFGGFLMAWSVTHVGVVVVYCAIIPPSRGQEGKQSLGAREKGVRLVEHHRESRNERNGELDACMHAYMPRVP